MRKYLITNSRSKVIQLVILGVNMIYQGMFESIWVVLQR